jgi:hypothetical protein
MIRKGLIAVGLMAAAIGAIATTAQAQDDRELRIIGLHQLCQQGDRRACVRFGMLIQQNHDRFDGWRVSHPEWFWWER